MEKNENYTWRLGMFVVIGLTVFFGTLYFIGKSQNLFGGTFPLKAEFKNIGGLKVGNNVLLSGINIGTIKTIAFASDSAVVVTMVIKDDIRKYIKTDALASIGSDGLMGDKILTISPGNISKITVKDNAFINSKEAVELDDLMAGLKISVDNAAVITGQLSEFSYKINNKKGALSKVLTDEHFAAGLDSTLGNLRKGSDDFSIFTKKLNDKNGTLSKLMTDPFYARSIQSSLSNFQRSSEQINVFTKSLNDGKGMLPLLITNEKMARSLDSTMLNLQDGSKKLLEIEEAAKHNFLLRGYFKKLEKARKKKEGITL